MSKIKGKHTRPELMVRKFLHAQGFRYRLHAAGLPGKPDVILPKYKVVIQIQGCFWHGHDGCRYFVIPKSRTEWWKSKIERTKVNDDAVCSRLEALGWKVIVIWECVLKPKIREKTLHELAQEIKLLT